MKRYGVEYCDEGGTLFDSEGTPISHTWAVVDRARRDADGHPAHVSTCFTRKQARDEARDLNNQPSALADKENCNGNV